MLTTYLFLFFAADMTSPILLMETLIKMNILRLLLSSDDENIGGLFKKITFNN